MVQLRNGGVCADLLSTIVDMSRSLWNRNHVVAYQNASPYRDSIDEDFFSKDNDQIGPLDRCLIYYMKCQRIETSSLRSRDAEKKEDEVLLHHGEILTSTEKKHTHFTRIAEMRRRVRRWTSSEICFNHLSVECEMLFLKSNFNLDVRERYHCYGDAERCRTCVSSTPLRWGR